MGYLAPLRHFGADEELDIEIDEPVSASGGLTPADFNSTRYPGICKPMNQRALDIVKDLQKQLNRNAHVRGIAKIAIDGDIGPGTLSLLSKVAPAGANWSTSSCMNVAAGADIIAATLKRLADAAGAPSSVSGPMPAKPPTFIDIKGNVHQDANSAGSIIDTFSNMSTGQKVIAAGLLAGIGYLGFKELKKSRR